MPDVASPDIQALLSAIPYVQEGQVIHSEHHNAIVRVLQALVDRPAATPIPPPVTPPPVTPPAVTKTTIAIVPALLPTNIPNTRFEWSMQIPLPAPGFEWSMQAPFASGSASGPSTIPSWGWMPIYLPQGSQIETLAVVGSIGGNATIHVHLDQISVGTGVRTTLIDLPAQTVNQTDQKSFSLQGAPPPGRARVDNTLNIYAFIAELTPHSAFQGSHATINPLLVTYSA
jgi:hypothetical protein